jgi:hypothetical protein
MFRVASDTDDPTRGHLSHQTALRRASAAHDRPLRRFGCKRCHECDPVHAVSGINTVTLRVLVVEFWRERLALAGSASARRLAEVRSLDEPS